MGGSVGGALLPAIIVATDMMIPLPPMSCETLTTTELLSPEGENGVRDDVELEHDGGSGRRARRAGVPDPELAGRPMRTRYSAECKLVILCEAVHATA